MSTKPKKADAFKTKKNILDFLKQKGPTCAATLADELGCTTMAVRQHLYELQEQKMVAFCEECRGKGRPTKVWELTKAADKHFPDAHNDLSLQLINGVRKSFGEEGLQKLLATRRDELIQSYSERVSTGQSLKQKLNKLKNIRSDEGYMAEVQKNEKGDGYLFIENHCPICTAATSCQTLCDVELDVFREVLGPDLQVERSEHILGEDRRCMYEVREKD